jgi:nitrogen regulatory protein PII
VRPVKRVEIVVDSVELNKVIQLLEAAQVKGYTAIKDVIGRGQSGLRDNDDPTGAMSNVYVLVACGEDQLTQVVENLRPLLQRFGGICLVSDAQWVIH